jgi:hypothetical protein
MVTRKRHSLNREPSVPRPLHGQVRLTRRQAKEMIHTWDQQIVRLRHRVEKLEEQNEKLRDFLADTVRICDEAIAAGRQPSRFVANMHRFLLFHSVTLRSQLQLLWQRLQLTVTHLPLPYRGEISPPVGWPFEPVVEGSVSVGPAGAPPTPEQNIANVGPARSSAAFVPSFTPNGKSPPLGGEPSLES